MARILIVLLAAFALASCFGGGGGGAPQVEAIDINPGTPAAGSVVEVTGQVTGNGSASAQKSWSVTSGSLSVTPPDFGLILRGTSKAASEASLTTTSNTVYWLAPAGGGNATLTLSIGESSKTRTVTLGTSPLGISIADSGGNKQVTVNVSNVSDLYQAAFRVTYSSAWRPVSVSRGDFLGAAADTIFFEKHDLNGLVPIAISRKGNAGGVDGSGTLAVLTFEPVSSASSVREAARLPFELDLAVLRDSNDQPLKF